MTDFLLLIPALGALLAAGFDLARFRIPNWLTLGLALLYFPVAWLAGQEGGALLAHLQAGGAMFALGFLLFLARVWGGGDAKLFGVLSLWLGWSRLLPFAFAMVMAGGVLALALLFLRRCSWPEKISHHRQLRRLLGTKSAVPYAVPMALGMAWLLVHV